MSLWEHRTISYDLLKRLSDSSNFSGSMILWLKDVNIIPRSAKWRRSNSTAKMLSPEAIEIGYLAEVAYDWSLDGPTTPQEFITALGFELRNA